MVIFVSHKLEEIEQLCDRVTIMRAGTVVGREDMPVPAGTARRDDVRRGRGHRRPAAGDARAHRCCSSATSPSPTASTSRDVVDRPRRGRGPRARRAGGQRPADVPARLRRADRRRSRHDHRSTASTSPTRRYDAFRDAGVHLLPAGRLEEGLVPGLTIAEHFELVSANRSFFVDWGARRVDGPPAHRQRLDQGHDRRRPPSRCPAATSNGCCWRCCRRTSACC